MEETYKDNGRHNNILTWYWNMYMEKWYLYGTKIKQSQMF